MARRSKIGDALAGFSEAYDQVGKIAQDIELSKLGKEIPVETVNPETGVKTTEFLGRQYDGGLNQDQLDAARSSRMADIVGKYDPMRGLDMRRGLKRDEREGKKFDQDMKVSDAQLKQMGQQSELTGLQIDDAKNNKRIKEDRQAFAARIYDMDPEELSKEFATKFNRGKQMMMVGYDRENRQFVMTSDIPGIDTGTMSVNEMRQQLLAAHEMGKGDVFAGMNALVAAEQQRHARQQADRNFSKDVAFGNANLDHQADMLNVQRGHLSLARERLNDERSKPFGLQFGLTVGPDGKQSTGITGLKYSGRTGKMEPFYQDLGALMPGGFVPESAFSHVDKTAAGLIGAETGQLTDKGGKVLYTPETAYDFARRQVIQNYTGQRGGQNGGIDPNVVAKMPGFMNPAPAQAPAPSAAQAVPTPQQQGIRATFGSGGLRMPAQQSAAQGPQIMIQNGRAVPVFAPQQQQPMSYEEALGYLNR